MRRRPLLLGLAAGAAVAGTARGQADPASDWPSQAVVYINLIPPDAATDTLSRLYCDRMGQLAGQQFVVENRSGAGGTVGQAAIAQAAPDGYTLGIITAEICMLHWQGLTEVTYRNYTPLGLMNNDPPGIQVNASSPHRDVKALADAIKASRPGQMKASGTGQGGIWHLALAGWLGAMGLRADHVRWVPSNGAAPAMQDLAAGGLDFTTCSVPEARAMLDAGRARSLAVMSPTRLTAFPNIPTLKEAMGVDYQTGAWRGIAGPPGLPAEVKAAVEPALGRVFNNQEYKDFLNARGFGLVYADGAGAERQLAEADRALGEAMKAAGLAKA